MQLFKILITLAWVIALLYFGGWVALKLVVHYQSLDWLYFVGVVVGILADVPAIFHKTSRK